MFDFKIQNTIVPIGLQIIQKYKQNFLLSEIKNNSEIFFETPRQENREDGQNYLIILQHCVL